MRSRPLPVDPGITVFSLPNGLSCWVKPHTKPPGCLGLGLSVGTGSLHEADDECGVSHMLEHLAFGGGVHFPPGGVARFLDSLGARLGQDYNAFTGLERTCYSFVLPDDSDATLGRGLACLADFAHGLRLAPELVESERRVILEEMRQYHEARTRIRGRVLETLLPGSKVVLRHPLGRENVVRTVTPERLRSYYRRRYRPEWSTLLVTGEVALEDVERWVRRYFANWQGAKDEVSASVVALSPPAVDRAVVFSDPDVDAAELRLVGLVPAFRPRDPESLRAWVAEEIARWLVNQRFAALVREGATRASRANFGITGLVRGWDLVQVVAGGPHEHWRDVLRTLARELRRRRVHGFADAELDLAWNHQLSSARRDLLDEASVTVGRWLSRLNEAVVVGRPPMSSAQRLQLLETWLPDLGKDQSRQVGTAFERIHQALRLTVAVMPEGSKSSAQVTSAELLDQRCRAESGQPKPPVRMHRRQLPDAVGEPGTVVSTDEVPEIGLLSLALANGVRVHLRPMELGCHQVHVELTLVGGRIGETAADFGLTAAAGLAFLQPATACRSSSEIADFLADKGLRLGSSVEEDAVKLRLVAHPGDLEHGLQLIHLLLTRPRLEDTVLRRWCWQVGQRRHSSVEARLSLETLRLLTGGDPRFALISAAQVSSITRPRAEERLRQLQEVPIEASIVGDLSQERAVELALAYLGSLPDRAPHGGVADNLRHLTPPPGPLTSRVESEENAPRAAVLSGWRAAPWHRADDRRLLRLASLVLNTRLFSEVRQARGLAYDVKSSYSPSKAFPAASLFSVAFYTPPERTREAARVSRRMVHDLASEGPTVSEMATVRKQLLELARRAEREPRYWSRALAELDYRRLRAQDLAGLWERFQDYSRADLRASLERYVSEDRRLEVTCLPRPGEQDD